MGSKITTPDGGWYKVSYSWEWRTGSWVRETMYGSADGNSGGISTQVLLRLWGWTVPAPKPPR